MTQIIVSEELNIPNATASVSTDPHIVAKKECISQRTAAKLPDSISEQVYDDESRNDDDMAASRSQDGSLEGKENKDPTNSVESENKQISGGNVESKPAYLLQTTNLFNDENESQFIIHDDDDCIEWTSQTPKSNSPQSIFSNLMVGTSRSFEFPSINTVYTNGNDDEKCSPRLSIPSPSAFLSKIRTATSSLANALSPSSVMGLEDVDLEPSFSFQEEKKIVTSNNEETHDESGKEVLDVPEKETARKTTTKPSSSSSNSIFGLEPFPWEVKSNARTSKSKTQKDVASFSSTWFNSSKSFKSSLSQKTISSGHFSGSFKKWGKELNSVVNEVFQSAEEMQRRHPKDV